MFNSVKQPQKQKQKLTTPGTPIATLENTRPAVFNPGVKFEPGTNGSEKKKRKVLTQSYCITIDILVQ